MSRLAATLRLDATLQARNKIYWIVAIVTLLLAIALRALFTADQLRFFMPLAALSGVGLTAFVLVGVLLLLERGEGTLDVVLVSPLRPWEYLASKLTTVGVLALVEGSLIAGIGYGMDLSIPTLWAALSLRACFLSAIGIGIAVRHRSITGFLFPLALLSILFELPVLWYLDLWPSPIFYLWPTLPSLLLAKAAFMPVAPAETIYAYVYGSFCCALALVFALRSIERFVLGRELRS